VAAATARGGLTEHCELDENIYPKGIVVSDEDMASINITRNEFHGEWNFTIRPRDEWAERLIPDGPKG